jgi:hypothetical protein
MEKISYRWIFLLFILFVFFSNFLVMWGEQHFSFLAQSFLHGKLYFMENPSRWEDTAFYNGEHYWPLGPFPAMLLIPFVWLFSLFGLFFKQGFLQFFLFIGVGYLFYLIALRKGFSKEDSWFWAFAFCFGSVFIGISTVPFSWQFAQVITTFLLFMAFYEYANRKRYWLLGIYMSLAFLTRLSAGLGIIFFILEIILRSRQRMRDLIILLLPFVIAINILAWYNYARFGSITEHGYSMQIILEPLLTARDYGLFNPIHIPGNLYYFLLSTPLPVFKDNISHVLKFPFLANNPWGMSIFITSPYLFLLFFQKHKDAESKLIWITVGIVALIIFSNYGIGYRQFGYRYSLDFLPWLFFLLIKNWQGKKLIPNWLKRFIVISAIVNLYLFSTKL